MFCLVLSETSIPIWNKFSSYFVFPGFIWPLYSNLESSPSGPNGNHSWVHFYTCKAAGIQLEFPNASLVFDFSGMIHWSLYHPSWSNLGDPVGNSNSIPNIDQKKTGLSTRYLLAPCKKSRKRTKLFFRVGKTMVCMLGRIFSHWKIRYSFLYI